MRVQPVSARPANPLATLDEDYERAVVHLAWDADVPAGRRALLFGLVELLPTEVPPPLDDGEHRLQLEATGEQSVMLRRFVVPARAALGWYLDCRRGIGRLPGASDRDALELDLAELGEAPPWPSLVCISQEGDTAPFCPAWHAQPRVHHLIPLAPVLPEQLWPDAAERRRVMDWLADRLHFSLEPYPEYWGSVHLAAPNPVYRSLDATLASGPPPHESVLLRFQPRQGQSVAGLEVTHTENAPWGSLDVRHAVVQDPVLRLDFDHNVGATKEEIFDPRRGQLASVQAAGFFRNLRDRRPE